MINERKYSCNVRKKRFSREHVMTTEDNENLGNSAKYCIFDVYIDGNVKINDLSHITEKFRGYSLENCNNNVKLNQKITVVFHYQRK